VTGKPEKTVDNEPFLLPGRLSIASPLREQSDKNGGDPGAHAVKELLKPVLREGYYFHEVCDQFLHLLIAFGGIA